MSRRNSSDRILYLLAVSICLVAFSKSSVSAQTFTSLHKFETWPLGTGPFSQLVMDAEGNLYGTTVGGGSSYCNYGEGCGAVFKLTPNANGSWTETVIYSFPATGDEFAPGDLVFDSAGNLYGVTYQGGGITGGIIFELSPNANGTWTESTVYKFLAAPGIGPSGLVFDSSGNLYGTTSYSGATSQGPYGCGALFELTPGANNSWTLTTLYTFGKQTDACGVKSNLIFDASGNLYASSILGGAYGFGTVFKLSPSTGSGWAETSIYSFIDQLDGMQPAALALDQDANIYGVTLIGGTPDAGTVFEISQGASGWSKHSVYQFQAGKDGERPVSIAVDSAGNLYGSTENGGGAGGQQGCPAGCGTVFRLTPSGGTWSESVIYSFAGGTGGAFPNSEILLDTAGNIYGDTQNGGSTGCVSGCGTVFKVSPSGASWMQQVIASFPSQDGGYSEAALVQDSHGNFYGTTTQGGEYDYGTVFELSPSKSGTWTRTILHSFKAAGVDGEFPKASLILDSAGNLYGTTFYGGIGSTLQCGGIACGNGTIFEMSPGANGKWTETILYRFAGGSDGINPAANLLFDSAGDLYGTTQAGGGNGTQCQGFGCGTVFELSPGSNGQWTEKVIYTFTGSPDGWFPCSWLVADPAGNLYGTTFYGGSTDLGAVFELSPSSGGGWTETVIYSFSYAGVDGNRPYAGLIFDSSGNLYGTTLEGGPGICIWDNYQGCGSVFELSPSASGWTEKILYYFLGLAATPYDGGLPQGGVVFDKDGNLYGTGYGEGASAEIFPAGYGIVYELSPSSSGYWSETVLHNFEYTDGMWPLASVVLDSAGNLYSTTYWGSTEGNGLVFKITP